MLGEVSIPLMAVLFLPMITFVKDCEGKSTGASPNRVKINVLDICKIFVRFGSKFG